MRILVLGRGKTGSLVAELARERGHSVTSLGGKQNIAATALTLPLLAGFGAVIDFTTPESVVPNLEACLSAGARVVVGTTGWYQHLPAMRALATQHGSSLLYGTNFSVGVQAFFRSARVLAQLLPGYSFSIRETHHLGKKDAPSGTALTLKRFVEQALPAGADHKVPIVSTREGDVAGMHVLEACSANDLITLQHEAFSRRGFAEGAVRAAEWLVATGSRPGVWDFSEIAAHLGE